MNPFESFTELILIQPSRVGVAVAALSALISCETMYNVAGDGETIERSEHQNRASGRARSGQTILTRQEIICGAQNTEIFQGERPECAARTQVQSLDCKACDRDDEKHGDVTEKGDDRIQC